MFFRSTCTEEVDGLVNGRIEQLGLGGSVLQICYEGVAVENWEFQFLFLYSRLSKAGAEMFPCSRSSTFSTPIFLLIGK